MCDSWKREIKPNKPFYNLQFKKGEIHEGIQVSEKNFRKLSEKFVFQFCDLYIHHVNPSETVSPLKRYGEIVIPG